MTIITIPKHLAHGDLVLIPREEYEAMKHTGKTLRATKARKRVRLPKVERRGSNTY